MIYLLDTSHDYDECAVDLDTEPENVGQLITPLTRFSNRHRERFAIDNGAFSRFDGNAFQSLLEREKPNRDRCLFVACPDIVGSARRTLEVFDLYYPKLHGWPIALVCQDGQEDLPIPWQFIAAVFIGGSTAWKVSPYAEAICRAAKTLGKWVHMGRVNTPMRLELAESWGVDSVDGTGISRFTQDRRDLVSKAQIRMELR